MNSKFPGNRRGGDGRRRNNSGSSGLRKETLQRVTCSNYDKAAPGDKVTVSYTGSLASNGKVFDSTEGKDPITFELGAGLVIAGWEQGLAGTCPGEAVRLTIPPELGYGAEGVGDGAIPGNAVLVFDIVLEDAEKPGLTIETLEGGDCAEEDRVRRKDNVTIHYTARLAKDSEGISAFL